MKAKRQIRAYISWKAVVVVGVTAGIGAGMLTWHAVRATPATRLIYTSQGYGGWVPVQPAPPPSTDPLHSTEIAYANGRYADAETQAQQIISRDENAKDTAVRKNAVRAMWILAYCSARKGEFSPARDRFETLREMASRLPDHGAYPQMRPPALPLNPRPSARQGTPHPILGGANTPILGEELPTLEEEGAFQHAVCVGALGDKQGAESEYRDFMKVYPLSVLVHAAVKRIAKYHGGDVPKDAELLWTKAMQAQKKADDAADTENSLCGPECLAELLHRTGSPKADAHALAKEMHTTGNGTSLAELADTARKHGMHATPLEMGPDYLHLQRLPSIAYIKPGHFVILDKVSDQAITLWDPDLKGPGHSGERTETPAQWKKDWSGILLAVRK